MATVGLLLLLACANLAGSAAWRVAHRVSMKWRCVFASAPNRARLLAPNANRLAAVVSDRKRVGALLAYFAVGALIRMFSSGRFMVGVPVRFEVLKTSRRSRALIHRSDRADHRSLCGAAPAMSASNTTPASALPIGEEDRRDQATTICSARGLVAAQVALSLVLVSMAGLFVGYLSHLRNDLGFERNNLLLVTLDFATATITLRNTRICLKNLRRQLNAIPGVSSATFSEMSPMEGPGASSFAAAEDHPEKTTPVSINNIAPDYFRTYGTPFLAGRDFSPRDKAGSRVAIINESAARDCFGNENPIGRHITLSHITETKGEKTFEVIGVVGDAKYNDLDQPAPPTIYGNLSREGFLWFSTGDPHETRSEAESTTRFAKPSPHVLKNVPIVRMIEMNDQIDSTIVPQRMFATLSTGFGALGALLAVVGLYGLLAYTVTRRTHEIGVRIALGAESTDVMRIIVRDALWMVCAGLAIGAPLAILGKTHRRQPDPRPACRGPTSDRHRRRDHDRRRLDRSLHACSPRHERRSPHRPALRIASNRSPSSFLGTCSLPAHQARVQSVFA